MSHILARLAEHVGVCRTLVEIGACSGKDTLIMLDVFAEAEVHSFEPDPRNVDILVKRIENDRFHLYQKAVSNKDGKITFFQSFGPRDEHIPGIGRSMRMASGSIRKPKDHLRRHPWCTFNEGTEVASTRLDTWRNDNEIETIDLMWVDVNGGERDFIEGAREALSHTRYLYTEFGPDNAEVYDGGICKRQILDMLPNFEELFVHSNNVFMKNKELD